jgi:hypothetical protein
MQQPEQQQQKKDYFWVWVGLLIVAAIVGVLLLKGREMQSVPYEAYKETQQEVERQMQNK